MKKITIAIAIFAVMAMVSGSAFAAGPLSVGETGKTYSAGAGESVNVPIVVSSLTKNVAGFAFTITHGALEVTNVTSTVIGTFTDLGYSSEDGKGVDGKVDTYERPLVFNVTAGETKIAGAVPVSFSASASTTLCTVTFKIPSTATDGQTFDVKVVPTTLTNAAAGYETATPIDAIITDDATYSPLLTATALTDAPPSGTVTAVLTLKGDANGDGKVNAQDALKALRVGAGKDPATDLKGNCDVNNDGKVNSQDALIILRYGAGKITVWP